MGKTVVINKVDYTLNEDKTEFSVSGFQDCRVPRAVTIENCIEVTGNFYTRRCV